MRQMQNSGLDRFGFKNVRGGAHLARTMMLEELQQLLSIVDDPNEEKSLYLHAIKTENCLAKRSVSTRNITARHLVDLYGLDPEIALFRSLRFFWDRDQEAQPLLALTCANARDSILRLSGEFIQSYSYDEKINREALEEFIDSQEPGRFSTATLKATVRNILSTWTKSGHLAGRVKKIRSRPKATCGSTAYALLLGYLQGARGESLLKSEFTRLLDCPFERLSELATEASRKGWIVFKRLGTVIEVRFPNLLTDQEMEWLREQN